MAGDSVLAVFDTAAGAVTAALGVQHALDAAVARRPDDRRHALPDRRASGRCDRESRTATVYGDGVNIAARLQALAAPGGIVVSEAVRGAVKNRVAGDFDDLRRADREEHRRSGARLRGPAPKRCSRRRRHLRRTVPLAPLAVPRVAPRCRHRCVVPSAQPRGCDPGAPVADRSTIAAAAADAARRSPRQAVDRGASVRQHERRRRTSVLRRRDDRGPDHRPVEVRRTVCHRAQFDVRLQGQGAATCARSRKRSASATCWRAACDAAATTSASTRSSSTRRPAPTCGPTATTAT